MPSNRSGTSRKWLSQFEQDKPSVELGLILHVLEVLALQRSVDPITAPPRVDPGHAKPVRLDLDDHLARTSTDLER